MSLIIRETIWPQPLFDGWMGLYTLLSELWHEDRRLR